MTREEWCESLVYLAGFAVLLAALWKLPEWLAAFGLLPRPEL
jgi:hypothetical protein